MLRAVALRDAGSEAAMAQLYRSLNPTVFAFVRRRWGGGDEHEVQAVVVDALYEVWRSAGRFAGDSQVRTWVLGIARHKLLDAARHRKGQSTHDNLDDHADSLPDASADLFEDLAQKQRMEWLSFCMDRLPADQRESLHLLLAEALPVEEIARIQDCPPGTVKSRVFHAKQKLRDCLSRWLRHDAAAPGPGRTAEKTA